MLKITIAQHGYEAEDITNRLDYESDVVMDCARERDAFKRAYGDVALRLSNLDGYFKRLFLALHPRTWWDVEVWDSGRRLFVGRIESPIGFNLKDEWVNITVFSLDKLFWEFAKSYKLCRNFFPGTITSTSQDLFNVQLVSSNYFLALFSSVTMDSIYTNRTIRIAPDAPPAIALFSLINLHADTTVEEFLLDAAKYYNAEFFIDPVTKAMTMKQRSVVLSDIKHDIDAVIQDDQPIDAADTDGDTYDYIHLSLGLTKPAPMYAQFRTAPTATVWGIVVPIATAGFKGQISGWAYTYVFIYNGVEIESNYSDRSGAFGGSPDGVTLYNAMLTVPTGPTGTTKRKIFRWYGAENYVQVGEIADNITTQFLDNKVDDVIPTISGWPSFYQKKYFTGDVWFQYNETTGQWTSTAGYQDQSTFTIPSGKIFELSPRMRKADGTTISLYELCELFGSEPITGNVLDQWKPLFLTRRKVVCSLRGKNYAVGDSAVSYNGIFPNDFTLDPRLVIKNPKVHLTKEFTDVEMFTI